MHKILLASTSTILLLTSGVTLGAGTELGPCLEMYCPYGCDAKNPKTNAPRCCREDEHIVNGHCECIKDTCGDVCYDPETQCCVNGVVTGKDHPIKKKVEGVCQEVMACPDETDECTPCATTCGSCEYCNDALNVGQCEADRSKDGALVGNCGKCNNGTVEADSTKYNTTCQSCSSANSWMKQNKSGTAGDCGKCENGQIVADSSKYNTSCQTCTSGNNWMKQSITNGTRCGTCGQCSNGGCNELGYSTIIHSDKQADGTCKDATEQYCSLDGTPTKRTCTPDTNCPSGSSWDSAENACVAEVELDTTCDPLPQGSSLRDNKWVCVRLQFPNSISTGKWQIIGTNEKAKMSGSYKAFNYTSNPWTACPGGSKSFSLTDNTIDLTKGTVSGFKKDSGCNNAGLGSFYKKKDNLMVIEYISGSPTGATRSSSVSEKHIKVKKID